MTSGMMVAAAAIAGVGFLSQLPSVGFSALVLGGLLALCVLASSSRHRWLLWGLLAGLSWGLVQAHTLNRNLLPEELERQTLWLEGQVVGVPQTRISRGRVMHRFDMKVSDAACVGFECQLHLRRVRLNQYGGEGPAAGEVWGYPVRLRRPRGFANPGVFDYGRWLVSAGFHATGYVIRSDALPSERYAHRTGYHSWRATRTLELQDRLGHFSEHSVLRALAVADKRDISQAQWRRYQVTGTNHLMAISGLHIGIAAGFGALLGGLINRLLAACGLSLPYFSYLGAALAAGYYSMLAGFSLPTQRALVMCLVVLMAALLRRHITPWQLWVAALLAVLVVDPLAGHGPGFWLSFGAVGALILAFDGWRQRGRGQALRAQWAVFVGLMPVLALTIGQVSLWSFPANLVLIPVYSLFIVPLNLAAMVLDGMSPALSEPLWWLANGLLVYTEAFLVYLSANEHGFWHTAADVPWLLVSLALLGVVWCLLPAAVPGRWLGLVLLLPLLTYRQPVVDSDAAFAVTVLDVGQGLAVVLMTREHSLIYDLGPRFSEDFATATAVVLPYLKSRGLRAVDRLVISHAHMDHAGGAGKFIAQYPVADLLLGEPVAELSAEPVDYCREGSRWEWDDVSFEVLHPRGEAGRSNDWSCVIAVRAGDYSLLLTGDIEADPERRLVAEYGEGLSSTVLVAPHHGSATSSSAAFLDRVRPQHVIFSRGYKHHYGHPHPQVVARYEQRGSQMWDTAVHGAISLRISATDGVGEIRAQRLRRRYFWE